MYIQNEQERISSSGGTRIGLKTVGSMYTGVTTNMKILVCICLNAYARFRTILKFKLSVMVENLGTVVSQVWTMKTVKGTETDGDGWLCVERTYHRCEARST